MLDLGLIASEATYWAVGLPAPVDFFLIAMFFNYLNNYFLNTVCISDTLAIELVLLAKKTIFTNFQMAA